MSGYKHNQLKGRSSDEIQKMFDKEMKRVNSFVAMNLEAQEISGKKDWYVMDIQVEDKNEAKWTKPSTGMDRVQEIEAEC
ncbi:hypothetical protein Tco_0105742, partial [Tanacetum coccineum]